MKLSSDEIIKWADDAGVNVINRTSYAPVFGHITEIHLIRIAKLAYQAGAKAERKECAKLCNERAEGLLSIIGLPVVQSEIVQRDRARVWSECAAAIRSRGDDHE
jgi:hypothetical protein